MKKIFQMPEIEIMNFSVDDIVSTSTIGDTDWDSVIKITGVK